jgi:hypothetical protein
MKGRNTHLLRNNLLILLGYSVVYRIWLLWDHPLIGTFEKAMTMACIVGIHTVFLLANAIDQRSRAYTLAGILVALIGFGACTLGLPA